MAVYSGAAGDGDYAEDMPLREHAEMAVYSLTKLQSETALKDVARASGLEFTILRPTSVYGPHTKPHTLIPIDMIRKGLPVILGDGRGLLDAVYVDDVARAMMLAAQCPQANGEVFNIGHETVTFNDFHSHYSRMLNRPVRHLSISVPKTIVRLLARVPGKLGARLQRARKGVAFLIRSAENTRRFPSSKATRLLGYVPQFSLSTGMLATELWAKHQRLVGTAPSSLEGYGPLPFRPLAVVHPENEEEIGHIIQLAMKGNLKAKAIGSLHSLCPIPETDGICLVLDKYKKLLKVDGPLVTVESGMTVRDLNEALAGLNLALPTNGSIDAQTVSGAISTATHGGSVHHGSLSDAVESVRIVRADGSILDVDRSQALFQAVVVSVGLLGILSTVTFRCVPAFLLQSRSAVCSAQQVLDDFDAINRRNLYTNIFYFPAADQMAILSINKINREEIGTVENGLRKAPMKPPALFTTEVGQRLVTLGLKAFAWVLLSHKSIQRSFGKFAVGRAYHPRTGRSDRVLAYNETGRSPGRQALLRDMEIAIPYEQARAAITVVRNHFLATQKFPLMPIHIRCVARSDQWLSPAYERDVCWLEFWQYPRSDSLFKQIHELLAPFNYRFHWGKETRADQAYIRQQYEKWDDFVRLREEWDPKGMFLNSYLESLFGGKATAG